jgi:DNA-binding NarL/FixJ family response regulator
MVVDDSDAVRARLVGLLTEIPGVCVIAQSADGNDAVAVARALRPDVIVLDLGLPGCSGLDVLTRVKAEQEPPIVIVLTNHSHDRYRLECIKAGADFFFDKSNEFDRVARTVADAIAAS